MMNLMTKVKPEVRRDAPYLLVGEAPGAEEERAGRPFIGKSGELLDRALTQCGLQRAQFSVANTCNYRPPNNDITKWVSGNKVDPRVTEGIAELKALIADLKPKGIIVVGNTPLWALTGQREITKRRGSALQYEGIPLLPTIHPAYVLRDYKQEPLFISDLRRFKLYAEGKLQFVERTCVVDPTIAQIEEALDRCLKAELVAVDIEAEGSTLACVGFAPEPGWSISIPYDLPERQRLIAALLATPTPKVLHNSPYDLAFLADRNGLKVSGQLHDTLAMARTLTPEMGVGLDDLTSLYTTQPYYKDLGVNWKDTNNYQQFYRYNCLDCSVTIEIANKLLPQLKVAGLYETYQRRVEMIPHAVAMSIRGIKYDKTAGSALKARMERSMKRWQLILNGRAGTSINAFSPTQVKDLLYKRLKLPVQKDHKQAVTTAEKKLMVLYSAIPDRNIRKILRALIHVREHRKFISSYLNVRLSPSGRVRSSFSPMGTKTGRWSASKYLITEGVNIQTVPPKWKQCLVADEGMVLWAADYSQIEARFVAYDAGDKKMIEIFETPGGDIHKANAARIFNIPLEAVTDQQRQLAKMSVHALNYNISPKELMLNINKSAMQTGVWISLDRAKQIRSAYLDQFDTIIAWQERVWKQVARGKSVKERRLSNPFGSTMVFMGPVTGPQADRTKNAAIAFRPQSTVPDILNVAIQRLRNEPPCEGFEVLLQIHDAIVGQAPPSLIETWAPAIKKAMDVPVTYGDRVCRVPVDLKVGQNLKSMDKVPTI